MVVYKVYIKDYKLKQGQLLGVLVERRKDLRGETPLESGLKWAKAALGSSLEKKQSIFIVTKELELRADAEVTVRGRILSGEASSKVLGLQGRSLATQPWAGTLEIAQGKRSNLPLDGILPQFMVPSSYTHFYGLSKKPFELVSDPEFFYMTSNYREILRTVTGGLKNRSGVILIVGEPGVGKTMLIHYLLNRLDGKVKAVFFPYPVATFVEFLRFLLRELGLGDTSHNEKELLGQLNGYLSQALGRDKTLTLFIDEAQTLRKEVLRRLGKLLEGSMPIQIILVGQPELEGKLAALKLSPFKGKIVDRCKVKKLRQGKSKEYIDHRLKLVGSSISRLFTPGAAAMIIAYARGIPRRINVACDNALHKGYVSARRRVNKSIVREVIREIEGLTYYPVRHVRFFATKVGFRLELSSYLQMATSAIQNLFEKVIKVGTCG